MEVAAACTGISSVSFPVGLGVVLNFQFISYEGKVGGRLLPCPLLGTILRLVGICSTKNEPGLGRSQSKSKEDKMACSLPMSFRFWVATCLGTSCTLSL